MLGLGTFRLSGFRAQGVHLGVVLVEGVDLCSSCRFCASKVLTPDSP